MNIDVLNHTNFLCGYMDAVARGYSDNKYIVGLSATVISKNSSVEKELNCEVISSKEVKNLSSSFCNEIEKLLNADSRDKVLFYLVEYLTWYKEYTVSCKFNKLELSGENVPSQHAAYLLHVNGEFNVLVYLFRAPAVEVEA
jgi:hypothetical protein